MAKRTGKQRVRDASTPRNLDVFLNQPNINMVVPWIYEIASTMKSRNNNNEDESDEQEDETAKDLECFLNQPNINMTIPWIYEIYKAVRSGGGSGGGGSSDLEWDERDFDKDSNGGN